MQLQDEIEELIWPGRLDRFLCNRQGKHKVVEAPPYLPEPPSRLEELTERPASGNVGTIIGRIAGGSPSKWLKIEEVDEVITFMWADAGVQYPHDDLMVISLNIVNYDVNCVFVDNRSSMEFYDAFLKMGILPTILKGAYGSFFEVFQGIDTS